MRRRNMPWHLMRKKNHTTEKQQQERFAICKACPEFLRQTQQCAVCGCFMHLKTRLIDAQCPVGKW